MKKVVILIRLFMIELWLVVNIGLLYFAEQIIIVF